MRCPLVGRYVSKTGRTLRSRATHDKIGSFMGVSNSEHGIKRLTAVFSERNEGVAKEERLARIEKLEQIATSVRARRSTSESPQSLRLILGKPKYAYSLHQASF